MKKSDLTKLIAIGAAVTAAAATTAIVISKHKKHKTMLAEHTKTLTKKQAYITGGGLSAFASALYLVRDCGFTPENIHIFTNGTRDCGNNETGFICRRGKTISIKDSMNFFDLISDVDSLDIPDLTVCDEILNIYRANIYPRSVTLIDQDKNVIDSSKIKISKSHRNAILALMQSKRSQIQSASIFDVMDSDFFLSPFWKLISALYGFTEESSAYEFVNCIANMDNMLSGIIPNDFDRYEEIVNPLKEHLKKIGVDVRENAVVTDIDFENDNADSIHFTDGATRKTFLMTAIFVLCLPMKWLTANLSAVSTNLLRNFIQSRLNFGKSLQKSTRHSSHLTCSLMNLRVICQRNLQLLFQTNFCLSLSTKLLAVPWVATVLSCLTIQIGK